MAMLTFKEKSSWTSLSLKTFFFFIVLAISCAAYSNGQWEYELRCCHKYKDQINKFLITLVSRDSTIVEMQLVDPENSHFGYDRKSHLYSKPSTNIIYASSTPAGFSITSKDWHQGRNKQFVISRLEKGDYLLKVIGVRDGHYSLSFYPVGSGDSKGSIFFGSQKKIEIKNGEVHSYRFPGKFDDVRDGSISSRSPTYFKVKRLSND